MMMMTRGSEVLSVKNSKDYFLYSTRICMDELERQSSTCQLI